MRYMMLLRLNQDGIPEGGPNEKLMQEVGALIEEMTKAGVLLDTAGLKPLSEAVTIRQERGKQTVIDGPFAEAKEFIGGYCSLQVRSREEAVEWASRFLALHGEEWTLESEIREVELPG